jgi:hypothetical protein
MKLTSVFQDGAPIDRKYTGEGPDVSPPISWSGAPDGVKSLALICDDPDAPSPKRPGKEPWVHWVIYNIRSDASALPEGIPRTSSLNHLGGAKQGKNSWATDNVGYRGPMPPPGSGAHRYFFKLYALDIELTLPSETATKATLLKEMQGHVLAECQLVGTYER